MAALQQVSTQPISLHSLMRSAAFNKGHKDVLAGKPLKYDAYRTSNEQWQYERGRLFGLFYREPIKVSGAVKNSAMMAFAAAWKANHII